MENERTAVLETKLDYLIARIDGHLTNGHPQANDRLLQLEDSMRICKWAGGIATALIIGVSSKSLWQYFTKCFV